MAEFAFKFKPRESRAIFYAGLFELDFYWPAFHWSKATKGVYAKTVIFWRPAFDWKWDWAAALQILGFGIGVCWNHCDNPNHIDRSKP